MRDTNKSFFSKLLQWLKAILFLSSDSNSNKSTPQNTRKDVPSQRPAPKSSAAATGTKTAERPVKVAAKPVRPQVDEGTAVQSKQSPEQTGSKENVQEVAPKMDAAEPKESTAAKVDVPVEEDLGEEVESGEGTSFRSLELDKRLLKAIKDLGFSHCTPIQAETLPKTLQQKDLIGQAQTGTGKTAAFLITVIQRCLTNLIPLNERFAGEPRALVIAPTRELVLQIEKDALGLAKYSGLNVLAVVGGMSYDAQRERLRNEAIDLLIATPGRLLDFLGSRDVYLDRVEVLVIDEADRMLDMGFIPDVKRIVRAASLEERQTLLFSATFSDDILNLAQRWTRHPEMIEIEPAQVTAERVEQIIYMIAADEKSKLLINLLKNQPSERVIIFCNRRDETRKLHELLAKKSVAAAMISGELSQQQRLKTLERFREGKVRVLVATDVAGRGIHVDGVSHVINYNLPEDPEDYVHRIGRTGRAGTTGTSISFACEDDSFLIPQIEGYIGQKLTLTHPEPELLSI